MTPTLINPKRRATFGRRLRAWYRENARDLPWRRTRDPYHILVSELMLQQTQVSRVLTKYSEFLGRFPTLEAVAESRPARVREAWSGRMGMRMCTDLRIRMSMGMGMWTCMACVCVCAA